MPSTKPRSACVLPKIELVRCQDADYLLLSTDDAISNHLRHRGTWEPHLVAISRMFVQGTVTPLVLDQFAGPPAGSVIA